MKEITQAIAGFGLFEYNPERSINDTALDTTSQGLEEFGYDAFCELAKEVNAETHRQISELSNYSDAINKNISTQYELKKYEKIGLTEDVIDGKAALIRHDIDFSYVSEYKGELLTNYQRMEQGLAPIDSQTGRPIELHHIGQYRDSPLAELTHEEHDDKNKIFHYELPTDVHDDDQAWRLRRQQHWKDRARIEQERITLNRNLENIAQEIGADIVCEGSKIHLEKDVDGKTWRILTIDNQNKTIDIVVDVKRFGRQSCATGITAEDIEITGYKVRQIHEVRGQYLWLVEGDKRMEFVRANGERIMVEQIMIEEELTNGDIVRYNTWNFRPYAIFETDLSPKTILCNAPEHKKEFILKLADAYCAGDANLQGIFPAKTEALLRKYHETRIVDKAYLAGYEIHHHGYGKMLLLPNDIHCRKLAHTGGSLLMNTKYYAVYIDNPSRFISVENTLRETLTTENFSDYMQMSIETREKFLLNLGNKLLADLDLVDTKIEFADLEPACNSGFYCDKTRTVCVNYNLLSQSPTEALVTELHEIRHAIQHDAIRDPAKYGFDRKLVEEWAKNFSCYIEPQWDYMSYKLQPVERDAEEWALSMLNINND